MFEACSRPVLKHEVITHQPQQFGGPNGIRTRVSVTTTFRQFDPVVARQQNRSKHTRLKHAAEVPGANTGRSGPLGLGSRANLSPTRVLAAHWTGRPSQQTSRVFPPLCLHTSCQTDGHEVVGSPWSRTRDPALFRLALYSCLRRLQRASPSPVIAVPKSKSVVGSGTGSSCPLSSPPTLFMVWMFR